MTSVPPTTYEKTQPTSASRPIDVVQSLAWREIVRFVRQRNRVVGAIGQPILFWLLFGAGMNQSFRTTGEGYSQYFIPGTLVLILLFTAIFATISIIEDRQEGFLQAVLVAPVPRWSVVLGKMVGGSVLAVGQGLIFLGLAAIVGYRGSVGSYLLTTVLMTLVALGLTGLGLSLAWRMDSTQGFHAVMSLLLMPMWLLSGAFFPVPQWTVNSTVGEKLLHLVMWSNPVTYAVLGIRRSMTLGAASAPSGIEGQGWNPSTATCWGICLLFAGLMLLTATRIARQPSTGDTLT